MRRALGFVFDIDGVLLRGKVALPSATASLQRLGRARVPYIFLTNGGGETEKSKAASLSRLLGVPVHEEQLVLSHTPMKPLCADLADRRVLLLGCRDVRAVAASYGLQSVVTPEDLLAADEHVYPFLKASSPRALGKETFAAVLCFHDPNSWGLELQCTLDVLRGGGDGTKQVVPMFASNGDLTFAGAHAVPRLAAGSFHVALQALWQATVSTDPLEITMFGKPTAATFSFARTQLSRWASFADAHNVHADIAAGAVANVAPSHAGVSHTAATAFEKIIMVGDNPLADIRGANSAGAPWVSVLVRSGMWKGALNDEENPAQVVVGGVADAVGKFL